MKLNEQNAELIGALIGDGNIYLNHNKYRIGFVGNQITDKLYFKHLRKLIDSVWKKKVKIKIRSNGIRINLDSKEICNFLVDELKIPYGRGKCEKVEIPVQIINNWNLLKNTLRGIADTDGSVFVSKKPGINKYPSIEITTTSKKLAEQIREVLINKRFRVAKIWGYKSKLSKRVAYKVPLNGKSNLKNWVNEIGFSNPYKLNRAIDYLNV